MFPPDSLQMQFTLGNAPKLYNHMIEVFQGPLEMMYPKSKAFL